MWLRSRPAVIQIACEPAGPLSNGHSPGATCNAHSGPVSIGLWSNCETTVVGTVRLSRLLLNTNLDLFGDFNELEDPTLDWRYTISWRLRGSLSLDYRVDVLRQPQVTEDTQLRQTLQFRYSWGY